MFRLYSEPKTSKVLGTRKNVMSKLQERLQVIGMKQLATLARLFARVHHDLLVLRKLLLETTNAFIARMQALTGDGLAFVRSRVPARDALGWTAPSVDNGPASGIDDRRSSDAPRQPRVPEGQCVYAIGDVHGRCDLLIKLLDVIDADAASLPEGTKVSIVFLGDYIDRGLQSRQVIDLLLGERLKDRETVFLMGNHEDALLRFREEAEFGREWARFGGAETLFSYGLQPPTGAAAGHREAWHEVWSEFHQVLPEAHLHFYQTMTHYHVVGDYLFVHAGLRPGVTLDEQSVDDMLWIRDDFLQDGKPFAHFVVHGHTPTRVPYIDDRRMGLDTAAFSTGILTAGRFFGTEIEILSTI